MLLGTMPPQVEKPGLGDSKFGFQISMLTMRDFLSLKPLQTGKHLCDMELISACKCLGTISFGYNILASTQVAIYHLC